MSLPLKDLFSGDCIIIGNGPSLSDVSLEFLNSRPSFGTNRIFLLENFEPHFYAVVNPLVAKQNIERIQALSSTKFVTARYASRVPGCIPLHSSPIPQFSIEPDKFIYEGFTVTYVCLQLAFWLGFKRVLLVGVDHRYEFAGPPNAESVAVGKDKNHFHESYFSDGVVWNNPDLVQSERSYLMAKHFYEKHNRVILNLTPGSALTVFARGDWRDFL